MKALYALCLLASLLVGGVAAASGHRPTFSLAYQLGTALPLTGKLALKPPVATVALGMSVPIKRCLSFYSEAAFGAGLTWSPTLKGLVALNCRLHSRVTMGAAATWAVALPTDGKAPAWSLGASVVPIIKLNNHLSLLPILGASKAVSPIGGWSLTGALRLSAPLPIKWL